MVPTVQSTNANLQNEYLVILSKANVQISINKKLKKIKKIKFVFKKFKNFKNL